MKPDDIYLAHFPYGDVAGMKLRPVLLLTGAVGTLPEILVAYISSVIPTSLLPSDIVLDPSTGDHSSTKLKTKSVLRLHKLGTIHTRNLVRRLGAVSAITATEVDEKLRALLTI